MENVRTVPTAWDPKSPSTLLIGNLNKAGFGFDTVSSDDGVGANPHEVSCLMKLVDCQSDFAATTPPKKGALLRLSQEYRRALRDCLSGWTNASTDQDKVAIELLKLTYAVTHLSEIFLLLQNQHLPGGLTAHMVRYLRLHHMDDVVASAPVETLLQSSRPDQVEGGTLYWSTLQSLVLRGDLEDAWAMLSRHSACQRCVMASAHEVLDDYHASIRQQDRDGFIMLQAILLSAPLPGGRNDLGDDGLENYDDQQDKTLLLDGVQRTDYQLWDASSMLGYNPQAAISVYKRWKKAVLDLGTLSGLVRRIPQLSSVLNIIKGDFSGVVFQSWAERLCAELLYIRPDLRGDDLHIRAKRCMSGEPLQEAIISVMEGNAGRVVETLYRLGGRSGAALPATMTALLCKLLATADPVSFESTEIELETDLLLFAADAIVSSQSQARADVGTRLAIALLLPHASPKGNLRVTAALAEILSHHKPETDADATLLLDLVRPLVAKKSIQVLDGCTNVVLSRYQHYHKMTGGAAYWLLRGMELEREAYGVALGSCTRLLLTTCITTSDSLLSGLVGAHENVGTTFNNAKDMSMSIQEDAHDVSDIREVAVLFHVVELSKAIAEQQDDAFAATHISACLADGIRSDGSVHVLAHPSMHWNLLQLASVILKKDEEKAPFDVLGMERLLQCLTEVTMTNAEEHILDLPTMRLVFANGLMRALVMENAKRKTSLPAASLGLGTLSSNLMSCSPAEQEQIVENMLDM